MPTRTTQIDASASKATVLADKARILADIEATSAGGIRGFDASLRCLMLLRPLDYEADLQAGQRLTAGPAAAQWVSEQRGQRAPGPGSGCLYYVHMQCAWCAWPPPLPAPLGPAAGLPAFRRVAGAAARCPAAPRDAARGPIRSGVLQVCVGFRGFQGLSGFRVPASNNTAAALAAGPSGWRQLQLQLLLCRGFAGFGV